MITVCIAGAGDLGGAVAYALARIDAVSRVVIIDEAATVAAGKALDVQQTGAIEGFHTRLDGTNDVARTAGCHVCVIADRHARPANDWSGDEGFQSLVRLLTYAADVPLVFAGADHHGLLLRLAREAGFRTARLIGSAPHAFAAAIRSMVAIEARCSPNEVALGVLGTPPDGFVVPWGEASIGGYAIERTLSQVQLRRIEARAVSLWPPGPFALGTAAAQIVRAILTSSRRAHSVLTVLSGQLGGHRGVASLPALISTEGIVHTRVPALDTRERVRLETALESSIAREARRI